jgi:hypothetical protein
VAAGTAKVALQLYTLRELTAAGMGEALDGVAQTGFDGVEPEAVAAERMVHLKDMRRDGEGLADTPLGDGQVDWAAFLPVALATGVEWLVVEQDHPGADAVGASRWSFDRLQRLLGDLAGGS